MSITVKTMWAGDDLIRALEESAQASGLRTVKFMVDIAKSVFVPVDTGLLRSSIELMKDTFPVWSFGSDVRYAIWVEIGSQGRPARRYLVQAAEANKHLFFQFFKGELSSRGW